jgi:uncharacterized protein YjbI with pentapeptide repeats
MENTTTLKVKKPLEYYNKILKIDFKKLFIALTKSAVMFKMADVRSSLKEFFDVLNALDLKSDPNGLAYRLMIKAMVNAAHNLASEYQSSFKSEFTQQEKLYDNEDYVKFLDSLNNVLVSKELEISSDSFKHPRSISFLVDFSESFKQWLVFFGLHENEAQNITNRLPAYFVMALNDEWRSNPTEYNAILQKTDTPFSDAATRELQWQRYYAFLEKQTNESVFGESFGLKQIFIPLRGYFQKRVEEDKESTHTELENPKIENIPFNVADELENWLNTIECNDTIKFISGGPGSGKSSLAKIWCAEVAEMQAIRVLFVPLHLFDLQGDIMESLGKFVSQNPDIAFTFNPLKLSESKDKLLIVFDGLDELSQQGRYATEIASNFITTLHQQSSLLNRDNHIKVLFLITGREMAIQSNTTQFRLYNQIIHLLPYHIENIDAFDKKHEKFLKIDQRNDWWQNYAKLKNKSYNSLPKELRLERLDEITAQPLLNYLVALSLERGKINFDKDTNLNDVYKDLIEGVHERAYEAREFKQIEGLPLKDFRRILEEIAISAWHGGDTRTTSVKKIEEHISQNNLKPLLEKFEKEAEKGILRLLTAFYFRQHDVKDGDKTFEFTHKSFGEYLTATRLVNQIERISEELELKESDYERGWSENEALIKWMSIASFTAVDIYLFEFIKDEIREKQIEKVKKWQQHIAKLISYMLHHGMPMLEPRKGFKEETALARNASEALLVLHSACANYTDIVSPIISPSGTSFSAWISSLQHQRDSTHNMLGFLCLNHLDIERNIFYIADLFGANLYKSDLYFCGFTFSNLQGADLRDANLQRAYLDQANLQRADLQRADLQDANLQDANLQDANLRDANLQGANLQGADLQRTNLEGADLRDANLRRANLQGAYLQRTNLEGAYLQRADLQRTNLEGANLEGANLGGANLTGLDLKVAINSDKVIL